MLSYAFTTLNQGGYEDVATEEFENIHNLFAAILAKGIGKQLKQGLYREYLNRKDDITVVRGKIDMPGTIRNRLSRKQVLTCEYDELSENNLFNQILKTTVMLLLRHARVDQEHKNDLKKEMLFFSNVDTIDPIVRCPLCLSPPPCWPRWRLGWHRRLRCPPGLPRCSQGPPVGPGWLRLLPAPARSGPGRSLAG